MTWWYSVLVALVEHLTTKTGIAVALGADATVPTSAAVVILRGSTKKGDQRRAEESTIQGWIECWEADRDPSVGYEKLASLEEKVIDALRLFGQENQSEGGFKVRVEIETTEGDGDAFRPSVGSRTPFTIKMRPQQ